MTSARAMCLETMNMIQAGELLDLTVIASTTGGERVFLTTVSQEDRYGLFGFTMVRMIDDIFTMEYESIEDDDEEEDEDDED